MKSLKLLFYICSVAFVLGACDTDIVPANGYIETTQQDAETYVLKGYENAALGFNVFKPEGTDIPFYLKGNVFMVIGSVFFRSMPFAWMLW